MRSPKDRLTVRRVKDWKAPLARPLALDGGGPVLRTLNDARNYVLSRENGPHAEGWHEVAGLLLEAADSGDTRTATETIRAYLYLEGKLDATK